MGKIQKIYNNSAFNTDCCHQIRWRPDETNDNGDNDEHYLCRKKMFTSPVTDRTGDETDRRRWHLPIVVRIGLAIFVMQTVKRSFCFFFELPCILGKWKNSDYIFSNFLFTAFVYLHSFVRHSFTVLHGEYAYACNSAWVVKSRFSTITPIRHQFDLDADR